MDSKRVLGTEFFKRSARKVAKELLGKYLVRKIGEKTKAFLITEVEAYDGFEDRASHASRGKTPRTEVMFGEPGYWYVYFVYGMYDMLNIVTGPKDYPAAILIRGVEGINGPGKLTRELNITRVFNKKLAVPTSGLWIENRGVRVSKKDIAATPRIGVAYAGEWAKKPWRFVLMQKETQRLPSRRSRQLDRPSLSSRRR